jgi:hypothetical protein
MVRLKRQISILTLMLLLIATFANFAFVYAEGYLVGTSTSSSATTFPFQRKTFYANGRFWVFYSDGSNMVYRTSTDGSTWTSSATVRACSAGYKFSIWFNGTYLHYAYADNMQIYYRRGTPNSNGSITWSASEQTVSTTYNTAMYPMVSVDSNGYVWIGYWEYPGANHYCYVIKSGNNDGTWGTTPSGFPYQLSTTVSTWKVSIIPLTSGKMLAIYSYGGSTVRVKRWDGSAWGSEVATTSAIYDGSYHSAVAQGDDVHLTFLKNSGYDILYVKYTYVTNSFGTETTLQAGATSASAPVISINTAANDLYVFAATKTTGTPSGWTAEHIYYKKYTASTGQWGSWTDWINETTEVLTAADRLTCFSQSYDSKIGLVYMTKTTSLYNVKFAYLQLNSPPNAPTLNSPSVNAWFTPSASVQFTWTFNDSNGGDSQSAFQLQIGNSGFSTIYVDTGKVASSNTNTTQTLPSTVGLYYWRVKTWDSQDAEGSWSSGRAIIVDRNLVGVTTADRATYYPFQRKSFYANERFWLFYSNGTHMVYTVSVDGFTWSDATPVRVATQGYQFSVWFDGTYVHYAYAAATSIYYRRGTPNVDGSITWSTSEQTVSTTYNYAGWPMISVDSNGYPWIGYIEVANVSSDTRYPFVIKSAWNNGSWLTAAGFPHQLSTLAVVSWTVSPIPLTNGKMAVFYVYTGAKIKVKAWSGSAWGTETATMSYSYYHYYSAVAQGDDVHLTFNEDSATYNGRNIYTKYSYATNTFSSETAFPPPYGPGTGYSLGEISINPSTNDLYIFSYKHVIKYTASSGTWSSWMLWLPETEDFTNVDRSTCFYKAYEGYVGFAYMIKQASPYYMKFCYLTLPSSNLPFIIYPLNSTNIISQVSWDGTTEKLSFSANGNVTVYVGSYGQPLRVEVNGKGYSDWVYSSTEQKVTIYNVDSNVALCWQELPPGGAPSGPGEGGGAPPISPPEVPSVVVPPEAVPLVNLGLAVIVMVIGGAYVYSQVAKPKTTSERVKQTWRQKQKQAKKSKKWKRKTGFEGM